MPVRVQKWGNSQGIRIAKALLAQARLEVGDEVDIAVEGGTLIVTPAPKRRSRHDLATLVARIPDGCRIGATDWGEPVGREVW